MRILLSLLLFFGALGSFGQTTGKWHTSFVVLGNADRLSIQVEKDQLKPTVTIEFPDQENGKKHKADKVVLTDTSLSFTWSAINLNFDGIYYATGDSLQGKMNQSGIEWEVTFFRFLPEKKTVNRPQEPEPPYAYNSEEILVKNGNVTLGATITFPLGAQNLQSYPIVVLASGSGPQDRDCELMGHKPFLVIADYLAKKGIACVRFDDRGVGKSTGVYQMSNLQDFASDVSAIVNHLAADQRFKGFPIGVAGHSEGGMHALIAARKNKKIGFVIELASVGTTGLDVLVSQQYLIPLKAGSTEELAKWNSSVFEGTSKVLMKYKGEEATEKMGVFLDSAYFKSPEEYKKDNSLASFKMSTMMFMNNEWMRQFVMYDASSYLKKLKIPILAINGSEDIQVPGFEAQEGFEKNLSKKSKLTSKLALLDGLNHLFQFCNTCTVMEYGDLEQTISPTVMDLMVEFIKGLR